MMKKLSRSLVALFFTVGIFLVARWDAPDASGEPLSFGFVSVSSLSIVADKSNFVLTFPDFLAGTLSDQTQVAYTLSSNNMMKSTGVFLVRLSDVIASVDFEAGFDHFVKKSGNASLIAPFSGFSVVGTANLSVASKRADSGNGRILDGILYVNYRAKITSDLDAKVTNYSRTLMVTFVDT